MWKWENQPNAWWKWWILGCWFMWLEKRHPFPDSPQFLCGNMKAGLSYVSETINRFYFLSFPPLCLNFSHVAKLPPRGQAGRGPETSHLWEVRCCCGSPVALRGNLGIWSLILRWGRITILKNLSPEIVASGRLHPNWIFLKWARGHIAIITHKPSLFTPIFLLLDP